LSPLERANLSQNPIESTHFTDPTTTLISTRLHSIYAHKSLQQFPLTFLAGGAMTGDRTLLDPGKPPDWGNAAENGLASNEQLAELPLYCRNKQRS
jgi:hypothetical protein